MTMQAAHASLVSGSSAAASPRLPPRSLKTNRVSSPQTVTSFAPLTPSHPRLHFTAPTLSPVITDCSAALNAPAALPPSTVSTNSPANNAAKASSSSSPSPAVNPNHVPYVPAYSLQQPRTPTVTPVSFLAPAVLQQILLDLQAWLQKLHPALVAAWAGAAALTALSAVSTIWNVATASAATACLRTFPILAVSVMLPISAILLPYQPILVKRAVIGICGYAALASVEALASSSPLTTFALPPYLALLLAAATVSATVAFADSYEKAQLAAAVATSPANATTSAYP